MVAHEVVALGRAGVVVEGHAGADDIDERGALVAHGSLDQRHELFLVARKAASDETRAKLQR